MQHFDVQPHTCPVAMPLPAGPRHGAEAVCGWFDSSIDLTQGLDVSEQDGDSLYRLWLLSRC